jgi:hypothetical protein
MRPNDQWAGGGYLSLVLGIVAVHPQRAFNQ